jgi:hypothetical protein
MCLRCDGYSEDDVLRAIDLNVRVHGFSMTYVEGSRPWTYTIGVTESKGHPDLVITDMEGPSAAPMLRWLYEQIDPADGIDSAAVAAAGVGLVRLDARYLTGYWFGDWVRRYGRLPRVGEFLQVLPPGHVFCLNHRHADRRLDRPG